MVAPNRKLFKENEGGRDMKKMISWVVAAMLLLTLLPTIAQAQTDVDLNTQNGRLLISEAGTYTLTGSMRGTVWVDPGKGDVTLIMDNITIDGGTSAGIAAVSGDSLTVILANGTKNQVQDGGNDSLYDAAIFCAVPTRFEGNGRLDVTGNNKMGIRGQNADLTFASGSYFIQGPAGSVDTNRNLSVLNATVMDMNKNQVLAATPVMTVQTGSSGKLALWEEPGQNAITEYDSGATVTVLENLGDWSQVQVNRHIGYMENQYLTPVQGQSVDSISTATQVVTGNASPNTQNAFNPIGTSTGVNIPQMNDQQIPSSTNNQAQMPSGNSSQVQFASGMNNQQQNGNMAGGMMAPGGMALTSNADNPSEIVTSTAVNTAADLEADMENAEYITVSDENSQVKISDSGTYVVTGSSSDGNITVKKGTQSVVLILDDLDLTSTTGATLAVNKEAQVKLIVSGNVTLTDAENPDDENSTDETIADAFDGAAMKFKANSQIYMTGDGTLTINGNAKNGIKAGDDSSLIIDGGVTININAVNDGINGNYDVALLSGTFTIQAGDDAIHADHILTIGTQDGHGPTIRVTGSNEGLEGTVVNMFGGDVAVRATDDAINAANGDGLYEGALAYSFNMTGGKIDLNSTNGDGIDSNGNVNLIGGSAAISSVYNGGDAGIDYDGQMYVSDEFQLNNASGIAGPDGMPGNTMNGQMGGPGMMGGQSGMPGNQAASINQIPSAQQGQAPGNQAENSDQMPSAQQNQAPGNFMQMPMTGNAQPGFNSNQNGNGNPPTLPNSQLPASQANK